MGSMCVLLQPRTCRTAPRSGSYPPCLPPHPLLLRGPSLSPLVFSSHGNLWRPHPCGFLIPEAPGGWCGHPHHPTMEPCVVGCYCSPWPQRPRLPYPKASEARKPPGPAASPVRLAVLKHDVVAELPDDVQVYLRDVPGGDQGILLHFLWENRGGGAGVRNRDPTCHKVPCWAGSPGATMVVCPAETSFLPLGGQGRRECPPCPWDLCDGLCPAVVGREVTEFHPGWEGIGVQSRWEGTWGCCAQDCESEKPLRS